MESIVNVKTQYDVAMEQKSIAGECLKNVRASLYAELEPLGQSRLEVRRQIESVCEAGVSDVSEPLIRRQLELDIQIETVEAGYAQKLSALASAYEERLKVFDEACARLSRLYFEKTQSELPSLEAREFCPEQLRDALDNLLSTEDVPFIYSRMSGTIGTQIVEYLCSVQQYGGMTVSCVAYIYVRLANGDKVKLTDAQVEHVWTFLQKVCPLRDDGGLAPPFKIGWMAWKDGLNLEKTLPSHLIKVRG